MSKTNFEVHKKHFMNTKSNPEIAIFETGKNEESLLEPKTKMCERQVI